MSQLNRPNLLTDIINNIYTNVVNYITGNNLQNRLKNIADSAPNILSDKNQANGYVGLDSNANMFSSYYNQNISRADLQSLLAANLAVGFKFYQINDAVGSTRTLLVMAESNINLYPWAVDVTTGDIGTYDIADDVFLPYLPPYSTLPTAPTVDEDETKGYEKGYTVRAVDTNFEYICRDASTGAAVWELISANDVFRPTGSIITNIGTLDLNDSFWSLKEGLVTLLISGSVTTPAATDSQFNLDIPIGGSFTDETEAAGVIMRESYIPGYSKAITGTARVSVFLKVGLGLTTDKFNATITYKYYQP